jgi:hypothetical protein
VTKHVQVRLEDAEYTEFEGKARTLGLSHQAVARTLLTTWASPEGARGAFDDLTPPEAATLSWILEFLRDDSIPDPWGMRRVLLAKGKEWASKRK